MVIKKRQILWDWTNTAGPGNPGIPDKINQVPFGSNSPVASVVNWNAWVPPELKERAPFRPMVRVLDSIQGSDWNIIKDTTFNIILYFNEPERSGISPEKAKDLWYSHMIPLRKNKGKKLGSPAIASDDNGRKWLEKFMSLVSKDPPDYLCLHYYSKNADDAIKYLENMHNKWPKLKVMVTEIACIDRDYRAVLNYTVKICNWMDQQDWLFEYGLFDFQRKVADSFVSPAAQLMDAQGNFTELGKMYCHQQPMKLPNARLGLTAATAEVEADEEEHTVAANVEGHAPAAEVEKPSFAVVETVENENDDKEGDKGLDNANTGEPLLLESSDDVASEYVDDYGRSGMAKVASLAGVGLTADQQKALDMHNQKRKGKNLKPLTWDAGLAQQATKYAEHLAKIGKLQHSPGNQRPNQGENLAWASGMKTPPCELGTKMWLDEEKNYHGEPIGQGNFGSYGHYTQCMWKSTTKLGMGSARDAKSGVYVVGRYSPPGNFLGQKPY